MRVLIAPDSFTGSMTAPRAAQAIAQGWRRTAPDDDLVLLPVSDGGPGFVTALAGALAGELLEVPTRGPWGEPAAARVLVCGTSPRTAYVEAAQAAGDTGGPRGAATAASSLGVAALVRAAVGARASRIVVGLGGTLVTDGGAGMLAGLGATATDEQGRDATQRLTAGGLALAQVAAVDLAVPREALADVDLVLATDVDSPLLGARGAARGFAPQKGADPDQVEQLEESLRRFAHACGRLPDGRSPAVALGAGAAGGLGFALLHLGGRRVPGIAAVLQALDFEHQVAACDLVISGEGRFDWQSLHGKVVHGVSELALRHGRPVLVLAGQTAVGRRDHMAIGVTAVFSILPDDAADDELARSIADGPDRLAEVAQRAARTWSR